MKYLYAILMGLTLAPTSATALDLTCQFGMGFNPLVRHYSLSEDGIEAALRLNGRWIPASQAPAEPGSGLITAIAVVDTGRVETLSARPGGAYLTIHAFQGNGMSTQTLSGRCN